MSADQPSDDHQLVHPIKLFPPTGQVLPADSVVILPIAKDDFDLLPYADEDCPSSDELDCVLSKDQLSNDEYFFQEDSVWRASRDHAARRQWVARGLAMRACRVPDRGHVRRGAAGPGAPRRGRRARSHAHGARRARCARARRTRAYAGRSGALRLWSARSRSKSPISIWMPPVASASWAR